MNRRSILQAILLVYAAFTLIIAGEADASSYVYVAAFNAAKLNEFTIGPGGALAPLATVPAGDTQPQDIAMTPDARHLYVTTVSGRDVVAFDVGSDGTLTRKDENNGGLAPTGYRPQGIAVSPDGKNIYVANYKKNSVGSLGSISLYDIAPDGSISAKSPDQVDAGNGPWGVAVSRDGNSVYVANSILDETVSQFDRASDGSLTPKSPPTVPVTNVGGSAGPDYVVLTPDGAHLYTANYNDSTIGEFDVGAGGKLTEKTGSPVASPYGLYDLAVSPDGRSLYAPGPFADVSQYDIGADGSLAPKSPASQSAGPSPQVMWLTPDGKNGYVSDYGDTAVAGHPGYGLSQLDVGSGGLLSPKSPLTLAADDYPFGVVVTPDQGPVASFTAPSATPGSPASFDASASSDPDSVIARYVWDFGDGTPAADAASKPSHTYAAAGTYTVRLTLFDEAGCSTSQVYTGTTAYCNGTAAATTTRTVTVGAPGSNPPVPNPPVPNPPGSTHHCRDRLEPVTTLKRSGLDGTGQVHIAASTGLVFRGRSHDRKRCRTGVKRVLVSLARVSGRTGVNCRFLKSADRYSLTGRRNCRKPVLFKATGTKRWTFTFGLRLESGLYRAQARAIDKAGNKETPKKGRNIVFFEIR
jgi:DNA-binding beta-propeller fold protein YncE